MAWWRGRKVLALGFDAGAITYRLKIGRLHPPRRGVYAVGHPISRTAHLTTDARAGRHRHPLPELNQQIAGHEVDAVYRPHHLVIELDSRQFHTTQSLRAGPRPRC
jgi:hypothetical protein